jgi:hypothetical protein
MVLPAALRDPNLNLIRCFEFSPSTGISPAHRNSHRLEFFQTNTIVNRIGRFPSPPPPASRHPPPATEIRLEGDENSSDQCKNEPASFASAFIIALAIQRTQSPRSPPRCFNGKAEGGVLLGGIFPEEAASKNATVVLDTVVS